MTLRLVTALLLVGTLAACARLVHPGDPAEFGPPPPDAREGLVFLATGDAGWARARTRLRSVPHLMERRARELDPAFVLLLGDNFYPNGVRSVDDQQWRTAFEEVYRGALTETPFYVALGNHDHRGNVDAQVAYTQKSDRWNMPAHHYLLEHALPGGAVLHLFVLDTDSLVKRKDGWMEQLDWLAAGLADSEADWKIVAGHHPVRSEGRHGSRPFLIEHLEPLFQRHGVALYLSGHDHDLQLLQMPGGTLQVVSGTGSGVRGTGSGPLTLFAASKPGLATITLGTDELWIEFHDTRNRLLYRHSERRPAVRE